MVRAQCPRCGFDAEATPGTVVTCAECGFKARLPGTAPAAPPSPIDVPEPPGFAGYSYLLGVLALLTFWSAQIGVPFAAGMAAVAAGAVGRRRDPRDPRGVAGAVLGVVGIAAAVVWLAL